MSPITDDAKQPPITQLLHQWQGGDAEAGEHLFEAAAKELRRIAAAIFRNERLGHTLQPTAIVNEAFVRLLGLRDVEWQDREHFFSFAATSMRRVLVDHARARSAAKRGGGWVRTELPRSAGVWTDPLDVLVLEDALQALQRVDPERTRLAVLRFYSGLDNHELAEVLGVTDRTVKRRWQATRAWLREYLEHRPAPDPAGGAATGSRIGETDSDKSHDRDDVE